MEATGRWHPGQVGILDDEAQNYISEVREIGHWTVNVTRGKQTFYDQMSGARLDTSGVLAARAEEVVEIQKHDVYEKVPTGECWKILVAPPSTPGGST